MTSTNRQVNKMADRKFHACILVINFLSLPIVLPDRVLSQFIDEGLKECFEKHEKNQMYKPVCGTMNITVRTLQGSLYRVKGMFIPVNEINAEGRCIKLPDGLKSSKEKFCCFTVWLRPWLSKSERRIVGSC